MKTQFFILLAFAMTFMVSCNKDDDNAATDPLANVTNKYSFKGKTLAIIDAEYYYADGDTYLFFRGEGTANYVQVIFANTGNVIPTGSFTFNGDRFSNTYLPESNFWNANISDEANPLGSDANGGTILVRNQVSEGHEITFSFPTEDGEIVGAYTGELRPR